MATLTKERTSKIRKSQKRNKAEKAELKNQKAAPERELMYKYPNGKMTQEQKKTFRRQKRARFSQLATKLEKLAASKDQTSKAELKKVQLEFENFKRETYTNPEEIVIAE